MNDQTICSHLYVRTRQTEPWSHNQNKDDAKIEEAKNQLLFPLFPSGCPYPPFFTPTQHRSLRPSLSSSFLQQASHFLLPLSAFFCFLLFCSVRPSHPIIYLAILHRLLSPSFVRPSRNTLGSPSPLSVFPNPPPSG